MAWAILADLLVVLHLLIISFVIGGLVVVLVGAARRWRWIRNPIFRLAHLLTIAFVALNSVIGVLCPLTTWEYECRRRAGQVVEEEISFVGRLVRAIIYYDLPGWVFSTTYVVFALAVLATLLLVPPRFKRRS
ncbi:MAG: DUF2784 domain-containing protein [Planctomycetota bacterium]|jgi:hypothetical protein